MAKLKKIHPILSSAAAVEPGRFRKSIVPQPLGDCALELIGLSHIERCEWTVPQIHGFVRAHQLIMDASSRHFRYGAILDIDQFWRCHYSGPLLLPPLSLLLLFFFHPAERTGESVSFFFSDLRYTLQSLHIFCCFDPSFFFSRSLVCCTPGVYLKIVICMSYIVHTYACWLAGDFLYKLHFGSVLG